MADPNQRGLFARAEDALFAVFHVMTEKKGSSKRTSNKLVAYALILLDYQGMVGLSLKGNFGWNNPLIKILSVTLPSFLPKNPFLFMAVYLLALLAVWTSFLDAAYVSYSFSINKLNRIWPIRLLRMLVTTLVTVLFIPLMQLFLATVHCSSVREHLNMPDLSCSTANVFRTVSWVSITLFIPFALSISLIYSNLNPYSGDINSRSTGRPGFCHTAVRIVMVLMSLYLDTDYGSNYHRATGITFFVMTGFMMVFFSITQPYHRMGMNCFRTTLYGAAFGSSMGSLTLSYALHPFSSGNERRYISSFCLIPIAIFAVIGAFAPRLYARSIKRRSLLLFDFIKTNPELIGSSVRYMRKETNSFNVGDGSSDDDYSAPQHSARSGFSLDQEEVDLDHMNPWERRSRSAEFPTFFYCASDVELMARSIILIERVEAEKKLRLSEKDSDKHHTLASRPLLYRAEQVYLTGMKLFATSPEVRLFYSLFLQHYRHDLARATSMLRSVDKLDPSLDVRFFLSSKSRSLDQERESQTLGGKSLDMIGMISFRRTQSQALRYHSTAVKGATTVWSLLKSHNPDIRTVQEELSRFSAAKISAQQCYEKLARDHPNAEVVARSYANFARDVLNDKTLSKAIEAQAEDAIQSGKRNSVGGPAGIDGAKSTLTKRSVAAALSRQRLRPRQDNARALVKVHWRLRFGLFCIVVGIVLGFVLSVKSQDSTKRAVAATGAVDLLRLECVETFAVARDLQLNTGEELTVARNHALHDAEDFHTLLYDAQFNTPPLAPMSVPYVLVRRYLNGPPVHYKDQIMSRWEIGNEMSAVIMELANSPEEEISVEAAPTNARWRFLVDNYSNALDAFFDHVAEYREAGVSEAEHEFHTQRALFGILSVVILYLAVVEFARALLQVSKSTAGVSDVHRLVPNQIVKELHQALKDHSSDLSNFTEKLEAAHNGESDSDELSDVDLAADDDNWLQKPAGVHHTVRRVVSGIRRRDDRRSASRGGDDGTEEGEGSGAGAGSTVRRKSNSSIKPYSPPKDLREAQAARRTSERVMPERRGSRKRSSVHPLVLVDSATESDASSEKSSMPALPAPLPNSAPPSPSSVLPPLATPEATLRHLESTDLSKSRLNLARGLLTKSSSPPRRSFVPTKTVSDSKSDDGGASSGSEPIYPVDDDDDEELVVGKDEGFEQGQGQGDRQRRLICDKDGDMGRVSTSSDGPMYGKPKSVPNPGAEPRRSSMKSSKFHQSTSNDYTVTGRRRRPSVSVAVSSNFVVVWVRELLSNLVALPRELKRMTLKFWMGLSVILMLQIINYFTHLSLLHNAGYATIDYTGEQRMLALYTRSLARELLIDDGEVHPTHILVENLRHSIDELQRIERGLLFGDAELGLEASFNQEGNKALYETRGLAEHEAYVLSNTSATHVSSRLSLNDQLALFLRIAEDILARFEPFAEEHSMNETFDPVAAGVVGPNITLIYLDQAYQDLIDVFNGMQPRLFDVTSQTISQITHDIKANVDILVVLVTVNIVVVFLMEIGLLRSVFHRLTRAAQSTEHLLELIPLETVEAIPELKHMFIVR